MLLPMTPAGMFYFVLQGAEHSVHHNKRNISLYCPGFWGIPIFFLKKLFL